MENKRVLFADDEDRMRELVTDFLKADGFDVLTARDGREALQIFSENISNIDLVILDVMMPHMDGYETLKAIKSQSDVPVILLTAKTGEYDELKGFNIGADEYIKKPFRPKILVARCNALIKRSDFREEEDIIESCGIVIDNSTHSVTVSGEAIELTGKEFELLSYFIINKNIALSREKLLENVWDFAYEGDERTVDTHVKKLRSKLKNKGEHIKTVWAFGYKFEE